MVVGDRDYQLTLTRLAVAFRGSVSMEYLQTVGADRIRELTAHTPIIAEDLKRGR